MEIAENGVSIVTKRATLNLSPEETIEKEQALGLNSSRHDDSKGGSDSAKIARPSSSPKIKLENTTPPSPHTQSWENSRKIIKTVFVLTAGALSLYLLKRRFF
jgi:hypothetical protein